MSLVGSDVLYRIAPFPVSAGL